MYLIFDFDGTIIDSFNAAIETFNILAPSFGFRKIHSDELNYLKDLNSEALIKYLKISAYKIPFVIHQARRCLSSKMPELQPFDHIPYVLQCLYKAKIPLGILTTNSEENVKVWLKENNMLDFFNFISAESHFFGKKYALKKAINKYQINKYQAYYFGDETRDIIAANQNKIYSVGVTWGFNSKKILLQSQAQYIVEKPKDILTLCGLQQT